MLNKKRLIFVFLCAVCLVSCSDTSVSEEISSFEEVSVTETVTSVQTTQTTTSTTTQTTTTEVDVQIMTYPKDIAYIPENAVYKRNHYVYIQGEKTLRAVTFYDENDNEVRNVSLNLDTYTDYTNTYDSNGNLISCQKVMQTDDNYYVSRDEYEYDENNRLKCANHYLENIELNYWETYEYNENGDLIQKDSWYDGESKPKTSNIFEYDENGNIKSEKRQYNDSSESYMYVEYECDENGRPINEILKEADGTLYNTITHTYDDKGNILTEYTENSEWYNTKVYVYDEKNRCTSKKGMKKDGTVIVDVEYEYEEL
ncbi:MAG: hypothetical protein K2K91_09285 [Ruminococcus sp.]|nr:hypothetical protein [Ruminococcus sp.]